MQTEHEAASIYTTAEKFENVVCVRPGGGGGGTPLYGLYRYVPRNMVWFLEVLDP